MADRLAGKRVLVTLGVDDVVGLEASSAEAILEAQGAISRSLERGPGLATELGVAVGPFYPPVGSTVLPEAPLNAIRSELNAGVPVLAGSNRDETTLWGFGDVCEVVQDPDAEERMAWDGLR